MHATRINPNDELLKLIAEHDADDAGGSFYADWGYYFTADQWAALVALTAEPGPNWGQLR